MERQTEQKILKMVERKKRKEFVQGEMNHTGGFLKLALLEFALILGIVMIGLMWGKDVKTPFSADKYNAELNSKFEQTTRTVYNQLIEMDDDEFNQLVKANSSYSLSKEQVREYRAVRQLIRDAIVDRYLNGEVLSSEVVGLAKEVLKERGLL